MRRSIFGLAAALGTVAVFALLSLAGAGAAHTLSTPHRMARTTAPDNYVDVHVTMTNTKFTLSRHEGPRGSDARFILKNVSNKPHNFELGQQRAGLGIQSGFSATVPPHKQKILILFLDYRGKVAYYGGLKTDRSKPGMKGVFKIGACAAVSASDSDGC